MPVLPTVATVVLLLLQVPPVTPSVKAVIDPAQTTSGPPPIAVGIGLTVTVVLTEQASGAE